ncbi:11496_t:CDS:2 [Ambispora gerdemannii]|uniref:11496_t:CDS:1 n=1 Tax=Ambispora gerdemannii TaxID=144530 RepID=A0A9N9F1A7_9GLOM|nr:11496_t:CDS:2 [Ambispora gerdemannii]
MADTILEMEEINGDEQFLQETTSIDQSITTINKNLESIRSIQTQIIKSTSVNEEQEHTRAREPIAASTKNLLFQVKDRIRKIERENIELEYKKKDVGLRKTQYSRLKEKFTNAINAYQMVEQTYRQLQEERIARQYVVVNPNASRQEIDNFVRNSSGKLVFQDASLRSNEVRAVAAEVQKRHHDIKNIEKTIEELVVLTEQIALSIEEQDDVIKHIGDNIDTTGDQLTKTDTQLKLARKYAISARKKKWIFAAIILVIIAIIVVIELRIS